MTETQTKTFVEAIDNEIVIRRRFAAPRQLVFDAWTKPEHLAKWWGPHGMRTTCEIDFRVGGAFRIVMHGSDGSDYPLKGIYLEVVPPEYFISTWDWSGHPEEWFKLLDAARDGLEGDPARSAIMTTTFSVVDGGMTEVTVQMEFKVVADRDAFIKLGAGGGWSQSFERLDQILGKR